MDKEGKILIVDDNEDILFALNLLLQPHVEKVKVTTRPERIVDFMESYRPDVILLDMNFHHDAQRSGGLLLARSTASIPMY